PGSLLPQGGSRMKPPSDPILEVQDLHVHFRLRGGMFGKSSTIRAVDGVSLTVERGRTVGLVGESGCGKSTVSRAVVRLLQPRSGSIRLHVRGQSPVDLAGLSSGSVRPWRRHMQMIFQDPYSSLDPRMTVRDTISEPMRNFFTMTHAEETSR